MKLSRGSDVFGHYIETSTKFFSLACWVGCVYSFGLRLLRGETLGRFVGNVDKRPEVLELAGFLGSFTPFWVFCFFPVCFCSTWFQSDFLSLRHPTPLLASFMLLHLISFSPSIQIHFIGMTGPVVGDSHRHGRTMHCDGDIHMIMPSDLTVLQIHLDSRPPRSLSLSLSASMCVLTFQMIFKSVVLCSCYAPAFHSTTRIPLCSSMSVSLPYFLPPLLLLLLLSTPCWQSH